MTVSVIKPGTFDDEWFGALSDREMLVWIGVFSRLRDDQGRFVENAALARSRLWPYRDVPVADVQRAFDRFVADGKLYRYKAGGKTILQVISWWEHQHPQYAHPSLLPAPDGWTDRVRMTVGKHYTEENWTLPGGFSYEVQLEILGRASDSDSDSDSRYYVPISINPDAEAPGEPGNGKKRDLQEFDLFWIPYPKKTERRRAERAWHVMSKQERGKAIASVTHLLAYMEYADRAPQFMKGGAIFLSQKLYLEWCDGPPEGCREEDLSPRQKNSRCIPEEWKT
jgi:hypothetical protein